MLSIIFSSKKKVSFVSSSCRRELSSQDGEGLRILITLENGRSEAVVVKPSFNNLKPIFLPDQINQFNTDQFSNKHPDQSCCYLKSCHLCHKTLSFDKEVYMYRGDMGFCSEQCRDRQIYIDEMKEYEISSQKILASFRQRHHSGGGGRCERRTQLITSPPQENRVIFL